MNYLYEWRMNSLKAPPVLWVWSFGTPELLDSELFSRSARTGAKLVNSHGDNNHKTLNN